VDAADLAALGFCGWFCAAATAQQSANGVTRAMASFICSMTEPFSFAGTALGHCQKCRASQLRFSVKLLARPYNFQVIRSNQQRHAQLAIQ
jgi:hypothetical protein